MTEGPLPLDLEQQNAEGENPVGLAPGDCSSCLKPDIKLICLQKLYTLLSKTCWFQWSISSVT